MRVAVKIELSKADRRCLERWSRSRSASVRLQERSQMMLMAADGMTNKAIAQELGTGPEQGRPLETALRRPGDGRDCQGAPAGR